MVQALQFRRVLFWLLRSVSNSQISSIRLISTAMSNRKVIFESHLSLQDMVKRFNDGNVYKGTIRINAKNYQYAFANNPVGDKDVVFESTAKRNRALQNDIVGFEILPHDQWKVDKMALMTSLVIQNPTVKEKPVQTEDGVEFMNKLYNVNNVDDKFLQTTAKVVGIFEKKHPRKAMGYAKVFSKMYAIFSPLDNRIPRILIPLDQFPAGFAERPRDFTENLMIAHIDRWETNSDFAVGTLLKSIGGDKQDQIDAATEGILSEFDLEDTPFPETLDDEIPDFDITPEEVEKRREFDFRKRCIFTIDPATARDLDDACSIEDLGDGTYEVGVHIADVSHFVQFGNSVDEIAQRRTTSVYLVQKVIPMLPRKLCEVLCSLNPGVDRFSFSVVWIMNENGDILSTKFGKSLMTSCCKMAYAHAQDMINDPNRVFEEDELPKIFGGFTAKDLSDRVNLLYNISQNLRQKRLEAGSLAINQCKVSFSLNKEDGMPTGLGSYKSGESNKLIEEFMLQANISVAEKVVYHYPDHAIIRNHNGPKEDVLGDAKKLFDAMGIDVDTSSSKSMQEALRGMEDKDNCPTSLNLIVSSMLAKSMVLAMYQCSGNIEEPDYWHYGLSVPIYTHFTSPIRRYPDLIAHRQLQAILEGEPDSPMSAENVTDLAEQSSYKKYSAKLASDKSCELFLWMFLKEQDGLFEKAVIMDIGSESIDVLILRFALQIRIWKNYMGVDEFQPKIHEFVNIVWKEDKKKGLRGGRQQFRILEEVNVKLMAGKQLFKMNAEIARKGQVADGDIPKLDVTSACDI